MMQTQLQRETLPLESAHFAVAPSNHGSRLRVMHVVNYLRRGGTEFGILKLMKGLNNEHFEHRLCTTRQFDPDFVSSYELGSVLSIAGTAREGLQFPLFRLKKIFQRYRPHIVHTRNWGGLEAIPAARLAGVPVVIHSEHGYETESLQGLPHRQRLFRRLAYAMADRIFTVTRELSEYHARQAWIQRDRIDVIYNGVDTQRFSPSPLVRDCMRRELGFPEDCLVVGSVGRMVPIKDYGALLKAAERLVERHVNVRVLLVGKGPELESLERQARESALLQGRASFVGSSDRVPALLNAMDIFALPSLGEGMSNTLLEAMASGLPLVTTRVGGNPEVVEDGRSGWLFTPGDVEGLFDQLGHLAANLETRRALGQAARERALLVFSLDGMIQRYWNLYTDAAAQHGLLSVKGVGAMRKPEQKLA